MMRTGASWQRRCPEQPSSVCKAELALDLLSGPTFITQTAEGTGLVSFGEAAALIIEDEAMVLPLRHGQVQQLDEQAMKMRGGKEILTARDEADTLTRVIHDHGEMIAGGGVFAREHDITKDGGRGLELTMSAVQPGQITPDQLNGFLHIQAQRISFTRGDAFSGFIWQAAPGTFRAAAFATR